MRKFVGLTLSVCWLSVLAAARADVLPTVNPREVGLSAARLQQIGEQLQKVVEQDRLAGATVVVARHGKIAYTAFVGMQDRESNTRLGPQTLFRIASMTKPITSVAAMMLVEEGRLKLDDPLSKYIPEFKNPTVLQDTALGVKTVPAAREIIIGDLLVHTSGLTYGFFGRPRLTELYHKAGVSDGLVQTDFPLQENVHRLASLPLKHHPGTAWEYGLNTDVLGRVIEVASGMSLETFFLKRIFEPLRMTDTHFFLPEEKLPHLSGLYTPGPGQRIVRTGHRPVKAGNLLYSSNFHYSGPKLYCSGGAGLVSTASDYLRFLQMLLNSGELDGVRLLKPEAVAAMTTNQVGDLDVWLKGHGDGFGYGFGVVTPQNKNRDIASVGTVSWGGIFNTYFLIDPQKELIGILMAQLYPSTHLTLREDFKRGLYQAVEPAPR